MSKSTNLFIDSSAFAPHKAPPITCWIGWVYPFTQHSQFTQVLSDALCANGVQVAKSRTSGAFTVSSTAELGGTFTGVLRFGTQDGFIRCYFKRSTGDILFASNIWKTIDRALSTIPEVASEPAYTTPLWDPKQKSLSILVEDDGITNPVLVPVSPSELPPNIYDFEHICPHCGGPGEPLNAPLTCGCAPCSCYCPKLTECPKSPAIKANY